LQWGVGSVLALPLLWSFFRGLAVGGGSRIAPANDAPPVFFHAGGRGSFHRHVWPRPSFGGLAAGGGVGGWVSPCAVSPLVVFPPPVCGGCAPLRSSDALVALLFMRPPVEPSGVGTPDLGWQQSGRRGRAAAARTSTTPAETLAGTQASPRQYLLQPCACGAMQACRQAGPGRMKGRYDY